MAKEIYAKIGEKEYTRNEYQKLVGKLSKEYALLEKIRLLHSLGYSNVKMAEILEVSECTIRAYLHCDK